MPRKSRTKFVGRLACPIERTNSLALGLQAYGKSDKDAEEVFRKENERIAREIGEKFDLLFEHYDLQRDNPNGWISLAYRLAADFIPGMRIQVGKPPTAGRPKKWRGAESLKLVSVVQTINRERRRGVQDAIRTAKKRFPDLWNEYDEATLKTRYYEALKRPDVKLDDLLALVEKPV
jgi:hypothetical protein